MTNLGFHLHDLQGVRAGTGASASAARCEAYAARNIQGLNRGLGFLGVLRLRV